LKRVLERIAEDRIGLIAAGCTYYLLLAAFPALAAFVSVYGFVADPETVADQIAFLGDILPEAALSLAQEQLGRLAAANPGSLSIGLFVGLGIAIWSTNNGVKTLFQAMNIAHNVKETRAFIKLNTLTLAFTVGGLALAVVLFVGVGLVPLVLSFVGLEGASAAIIAALRWPLLLVLVLAGVALLYRYGPSQHRLGWRAIMPGTSLAVAGWLVASLFYSSYLANFANYNATYGSLGAVIGSLAWVWLLMFVLLIGAEFNAALKERSGSNSETAGPAARRSILRPPATPASAGRLPSSTDGAPRNALAARAGVVVGSALRNLAAKLRRLLAADRS
jgi:membrane protein